MLDVGVLVLRVVVDQLLEHVCQFLRATFRLNELSDARELVLK